MPLSDNPFKLLEDEIQLRAPLEGEEHYARGLWDKRQGVLYMLTAPGQEPCTMMEDLRAAVPTFTDTPQDSLTTVRIEGVYAPHSVLHLSAPSLQEGKRVTVEITGARVLWIAAPPL